MSNKLQVINQQLDAAPTLKDMLSLPIVAERFIANYEKTTGKKDGLQRLEQEIFNFVELANDNPRIKECSNFSKFAAIVKAGTTGLSFKDGHLYAIPYGKTLKTSIGAHGKREMLMRMNTIEFVSEAQLVMKGDKFVYDKANSIVLEHPVDMSKSVKLSLDNIMGAYFRIEFTGGRVIDILMTQEELIKAKAAAKTKQVWEAWPGEMCKKSVYNRGFKLYHRYPEGEYGEFSAFNDDEEEPFVPPTPEKKTPPPPKPNPEPAPKSTDDIEDAQVVEDKGKQEPKANDDQLGAF